MRGQSLIELVVAIGIFVIVVSILVFLILNSYVAGRLASEITQANFLAEEGLEVARSIRDNSWDDLTVGDHGLSISASNNWIFQPGATSEDISDQLRAGAERIITIEEDVGLGRKKIISQVTWLFTEAKPQEIRLITYLTNWAEPLPPYLAQLHYRWRNNDGSE